MSAARKKDLRTAALLLGIAVCAALVSRYWVQLMLIQGHSMEPTYHNWQLTAVDKRSEAYAVGDVVTFRCPEVGVLVKRIAAQPGQTVQIVEGTLLLDGVPGPHYLGKDLRPAGLAAAPLTLGPGEYFMLGDNFSQSKDSRDESIGIIPQEDIIGRVIPQRAMQ